MLLYLVIISLWKPIFSNWNLHSEMCTCHHCTAQPYNSRFSEFKYVDVTRIQTKKLPGMAAQKCLVAPHNTCSMMKTTATLTHNSIDYFWHISLFIQWDYMELTPYACSITFTIVIFEMQHWFLSTIIIHLFFCCKFVI